MKKLYLIILAFFFASHVNAAEMLLTKDSRINEIRISGRLEMGDAEKFEALISDCKSADNPGGRVIFDGTGNNFLAGIKIGEAIFKNGWGTLIKEDGICDGACALAFLGGRFFGASSGWGYDRNLEYGATLGFTSPAHLPARGERARRAGQAGKELPYALYGYFVKIGLEPSFGLTIMNLQPKDELFINTPRYLKKLDINVITPLPVRKEDLSMARAAQAAMQLLMEKQPEDWEFEPKTQRLTPVQFKREILNAALHREQEDGDGNFPLARQIARAIKSNNIHTISTVFDELNSLGVIPVSPSEKSQIIKVTGLTNVHYYMSKICYFIINGTGTPQISVDYFFMGMPEQTWDVRPGYFKKYGTVMYELYDPETELWQVGGGN